PQSSASRRRGASGPSPATRTASRWPWLDGASDLATLGLAIWLIVALSARMANARYQTDECFHAYMAEWIAAHHTLPRIIPELYSGFYYYSPPLFHLLGAAWSVVFGLDALRYINVAVTALVLVTLYAGCRALGARTAARWSVVLCAANGWLAY